MPKRPTSARVFKAKVIRIDSDVYTYLKWAAEHFDMQFSPPNDVIRICFGIDILHDNGTLTPRDVELFTKKESD